jgi:hypothetical protein
LHLKRTYIDATIEHAIEMTISLVVERWRSEVRIAGVNRWAARQQRVRKGWAAVVLQRTTLPFILFRLALIGYQSKSYTSTSPTPVVLFTPRTIAV